MKPGQETKRPMKQGYIGDDPAGRGQRDHFGEVRIVLPGGQKGWIKQEHVQSAINDGAKVIEE